MKRRVLFVAGEASGDAQAARLAAALGARAPDLELYGVGGDEMRRAGVCVDVDVGELSVMGFSELAGSAARILGHYRRLRGQLRSADPPDLFVPVDFPDFNLRLARAAKRAGVPVFYYIAPQVWAWRRGRLRAMARDVDRLIALFPFEVDLYRERGLDAHFVGYPLAEEIAPARARDDVRREAGVGDDQRMVAVLPGSRRHEVEEHWPLFVETVRRLGPGVRAALAAAPGVDGAALAERARAGGLDVAVFDGQTYSLVAASDVALTVSGTATVECALLGCPMVVAYRMPASSFAVARRLVRVDAIAMPNLLLGRRAVPEFVQDEASPAALAAALRRFLDDPDHRRETIDALAGIRTQLVRPGAAERAADLLLETLGDR